MAEFFNTMRSVALVLEAVFGFLPGWVLVFVGSCFLLLIGLIAYKLIRG